jgi:hypothetical protein
VDDRRKNDRVDAYDVGLTAINEIDGQRLGIIGNLSPGGMMLIATRELYADGILQLKIDVPAELGSGFISVGVKTLWCTAANSPHEFWAGLENIDISPEDRDSLHKLLDRLSIDT